MRSSLILVALPMLALALSCGGGDTKPTPKPEPKAAAGLPDGYTTWTKVNAETIVREEEGLAREIYADVKPDFGKDTVLVKEEYAWADGALGELAHVAVMRRTGGETNNGWEFAAFDAATKEPVEGFDAAGCVGCHTLQIDNDFLFTPRDALTAGGGEAPAEGAEVPAEEGPGDAEGGSGDAE